MRLVSFLCFAAAAFAWVPPFLDRPGLAALGLALAALSFPVPQRRPFLSRLPGPAVAPPAILDDDGRLSPERLDAIMRYGR